MTAPAPYPAFDGSQACGNPDIDPDLFFDGSDPSSLRAAISVCRSCLWREPCAAYALTHDVRGVWGGLSGPTRLAVQRKHDIKAEPLELSDTGTRAAEVQRLAAHGTPPRLIAEQLGVWLETVYRILGRTSP